jgi:hypothetical protein
MCSAPQFFTMMWFFVQFASQATQPKPIPEKDIGPAYIQPQKAGPAIIDGIHYEYVATKEREVQIIDGVQKLEAGPFRADVRKLLGPPDIGRPLYGKYNSVLIYWDYIYRIRYRDKTDWNDSDYAVELFFTPTGRLDWARVHGVPGLSKFELVHRMGGTRVGYGRLDMYPTIDLSSSR